MRTRIPGRVAVMAVGIAVPLLAGAGPALAKVRPDDGEVSGPPLGIGMTLLYYVVIPVGIFAILAAFALLPSALSRSRYRPGKPWHHDPLWFRGPEDPETALRDARSGATARGGASAEW